MIRILRLPHGREFGLLLLVLLRHRKDVLRGSEALGLGLPLHLLGNLLQSRERLRQRLHVTFISWLMQSHVGPEEVVQERVFSDLGPVQAQSALLDQ
jgi:hypothetical protein